MQVLTHDLDVDAIRRKLRARRLGIMVRYQVDAVFNAVRDGEPATRHDLAWVKLLTDADAVRLLRIFEALRRIDLGTYGQCAGCGMSIDAQVLAATPEAHNCEVCATFASCAATDLSHAH